MLQASELRIGNYLNFTFMGLTEVYSVFEFTHNNVKITEDTQYQISMVSGIPLTEELLLKMGFVYHDYIWYHKDTATVTIMGVDGCLVVHVHSHPLIHIKFLHQLQNNFYFNTDLELTLS